MSHREDVDHYFGDPRFEGSQHPDAPPVEAYYCDECGLMTPNDPETRIQMCDVCGALRRREIET